jgi:thiol-disulfide isomerase/thioredoxin
MKLLKKIIEHYKNASWFTRISDLLFYALIIALLFPSSRNWLIAHAQRLVMWSPSEKKQAEPLTLPAWQWFVLDSTGHQIKLEQLKGKVIFINFWATWCAPCLAEMPALQDLYNKFKDDERIVFLFVTDEDLNKARQFLKSKGYNLPVYRMIYAPPEPLAHNSIPSTYLIDSEGRVVAEAHRSKRWNSAKSIRMIKRLMRE